MAGGGGCSCEAVTHSGHTQSSPALRAWQAPAGSPGSGLHYMGGQHRSSHGAHTARHRGDGSHHRLSLVKADVAAEFAGLVGVDAHIHHRLPRGKAAGSNGPAPAHGHHQHIGLTAQLL